MAGQAPEGQASATLELHFARTGIDQYQAELRYSGALDDAVRLVRGTAALRFADSRGSDAAIDPVGVGDRLKAELFADPAVAAEFSRVLAVTEATSEALHVRLFIDPSAAELQLLPWEALRHPDRHSFLFLGDRISFSRFLPTGDFRPVPPLARGKLTASITIASPTGLDQYALAPLDVAGWRRAAEDALQGFKIRDPAPGRKATLSGLVEDARSGADILYLVCHGSIPDGEAFLWLEDEAGEIARVSGAGLVEELRALQTLPRLVILFSCGSGGNDISFHSAIGPALAEAGIPAVVAMRGEVPLESGARFVASLLEDLVQHGYVTRAVAFARRAMESTGDALLPVLFSRLREGRIWYRPGFVSDGSQYEERWQTLVDRLNDEQCLPIIGPGLSEPLFGTTRDLARRWSEDFGFPLARHARDNLAQVAQYLVISQDANRPRELLEKHVKGVVEQSLGRGAAADLPLLDRIDLAWDRFAETAPTDPFRLLAELPFPLYITTNTDGLLEHALRKAGRSPVSEVCRWDGRDLGATVFERDPDYRPSRERPLVYHLFRMLRREDKRFPSSLLTEDNYFDYLLGVTNRRELIPPAIRCALSDSALLFLGFQIDELDFRVLFRSIINQDNLANMRLYNHVAVQIDPEEGRILEPARARRYLAQYFRELANVSVYWGGAAEFVAQAFQEWKARNGQADARDGG
ncbi:MAG TPA: CHAT domain-containing protein [Allosphingosinicella sp.]